MVWSLIQPDKTEITLRDLSVSVRSVPGAGVPPIEQITVRTGTELVYQRSLVQPRTLILKLLPRERSCRLGALRSALIQALNPELVSAERPAYLRYTSEQRAVQVPVVYSGGLEDEAVTPEGKQAALELRLISYEPIWTATESVSHPLTVRSALVASQVLLRSSGVWSTLPALAGVQVLFSASDGTLYAGGSFSGRLAYWDGAAWQTVMGAQAISNGTVYAIVERPDGSLYIGGSFSTPALKVVRYDSVIPAWDTSIGDPGFDVRALLYTSTGVLYAGGEGPVVKRWSKPTWWATADFTDGSKINALAELRNGSIIAAGDFTGGIAAWALTAWEKLGGGLSLPDDTGFTVNDLEVGVDGTLYVAGKFTYANHGLLSVSNVAQWNGTTWYGLSFGPGAETSTLAVADDGVLFVGGIFGTVDGRNVPGKLAQWNGYAWFALDMQPSEEVNVTAVTTRGDTLAVAYSGMAGNTTSIAAITTITNTGNAAAYPMVKLTGPGTIYELVNYTTGDTIAFNLALLDGEMVLIDLQPGDRTVTSNFRGNLMNRIIPGSSVAAWRLDPGPNRIALFVINDESDPTDAEGTITWHARFWSLDSDR